MKVITCPLQKKRGKLLKNSSSTITITIFPSFRNFSLVKGISIPTQTLYESTKLMNSCAEKSTISPLESRNGSKQVSPITSVTYMKVPNMQRRNAISILLSITPERPILKRWKAFLRHSIRARNHSLSIISSSGMVASLFGSWWKNSPSAKWIPSYPY